jgi:hypothetical protein
MANMLTVYMCTRGVFYETWSSRMYTGINIWMDPISSTLVLVYNEIDRSVWMEAEFRSRAYSVRRREKEKNNQVKAFLICESNNQVTVRQLVDVG